MLEKLNAIVSKSIESMNEAIKETSVKNVSESPIQASMETIENTSLNSLKAQNEAIFQAIRAETIEPNRIIDNQPNSAYWIDGVKYETDDNGNLYKADGRLLPSCEFSVNGYNYKTDDSGRVIEASGKLRLSGESRQPLNEQGVGGADKKETDDRGHIIADRFGGSNKIENLVAQDSNLNRGAIKTIENECADALKQGKEVSIGVEVNYEDDSKRPSDFTITYKIDGETYEKTFINERQEN